MEPLSTGVSFPPSFAATTKSAPTTTEPKGELVVQLDPGKERFLKLKTLLESAIDRNFETATDVLQALLNSTYHQTLPLVLKPLFDCEATIAEAVPVARFILEEMYRDGLSPQINSFELGEDANLATSQIYMASLLKCEFGTEALLRMNLAGKGLFPKKYLDCWDVATYLLKEALPQNLAEEALQENPALQKSPNPVAAYQLSVIYERSSDHHNAWKFLQLAAGLDNPDALCRLGELYLDPEKHQLAQKCYSGTIEDRREQQQRTKITGEKNVESAGITKSEATAEKYFKQAVERGSKHGSELLERMYLDGRGKGALAYFESGIKEGKPSAKYGLAVLYEKGITVSKDERKAFELFTEAANAGSPDALYRLAESHLKSSETLQHCAAGSAAKSYLIKAANLGHAKAAFMLGMDSIPQGLNLKLEAKHSYKEAEQYFRIAFDHGYPGAAFQLGLMNLHGSAAGANIIEAIKFLKQAACAGDLDAYCQLGELCMVDIDPPLISQNLANAKSWFAAAADKGHAKAAHLLTRFYIPSKHTDDAWFLPLDQAGRESEWAAEKKALIEKFHEASNKSKPDKMGVELSFYRTNPPKLFELLQTAEKGGIREAGLRLVDFLNHAPDESGDQHPDWYTELWFKSSGRHTLFNKAKREQIIEQLTEKYLTKEADQGDGPSASRVYMVYKERLWSSALTPPFIDYQTEAKKYYGIALKDGCYSEAMPDFKKPSNYVLSLLEAAKSELPDAQYRLGELYRVGDKSLNIQQDLNLAEKYLRQALDKQHPKAAYSLGQMIESRSFFTAPFANNEGDAIRLYEIARDGGAAEAALRLGQLYEPRVSKFSLSDNDTKAKSIANYEIAAKSDDEQIKETALSALKKLRPLVFK